MKKNGFFTFCCALVPGFGQMYYGYMRRGVSIAAWFWGIVFLASLTGLGIIAFVLPVIWAYSFFDTYNIRNLSTDQRAMFRDEYIPNGHFMKNMGVDKWLKNAKTSRFVGFGLIALGLLILYNLFINNFYWRLREYFPFLSYLVNSLPALLIAGAAIFVGVRVLQGKKPNGKPLDDDYSGYVPPAPSCQQPEYPSPFTAAGTPAPEAPATETPIPKVDPNVELTVDSTPELFVQASEDTGINLEVHASTAETDASAAAETAEDETAKAKKKGGRKAKDTEEKES